MQLTMIDRIVFVSGVSQKATAYKQIKGMFGANTRIVFLAPGQSVQSFDDKALAGIGLRRMTDDEKAAFEAAKTATQATGEAAAQ
jgi:hypothetical protein